MATGCLHKLGLGLVLHLDRVNQFGCQELIGINKLKVTNEYTTVVCIGSGSGQSWHALECNDSDPSPILMP